MEEMQNFSASFDPEVYLGGIWSNCYSWHNSFNFKFFPPFIISDWNSLMDTFSSLISSSLVFILSLVLAFWYLQSPPEPACFRLLRGLIPHIWKWCVMVKWSLWHNWIESCFLYCWVVPVMKPLPTITEWREWVCSFLSHSPSYVSVISLVCILFDFVINNDWKEFFYVSGDLLFPSTPALCNLSIWQHF